MDISFIGYDNAIKRYCFKVRFSNSFECKNVFNQFTLKMRNPDVKSQIQHDETILLITFRDPVNKKSIETAFEQIQAGK